MACFSELSVAVCAASYAHVLLNTIINASLNPLRYLPTITNFIGPSM